jgi:predicted protein tyrosine phosphatase
MNQWRSPTAERLFDNIPGYQAHSAGTHEAARVRVTAGLLGWADALFTMERKHAERLREKFPAELAGKELFCLDIPDSYHFMDAELIDLLKSGLSQHGIELP